MSPFFDTSWAVFISSWQVQCFMVQGTTYYATRLIIKASKVSPTLTCTGLLKTKRTSLHKALADEAFAERTYSCARKRQDLLVRCLVLL